jgi:hypothetical protein
MMNISIGLLFLTVIVGLVLLGLLGWGIFLLLVQLGVIVNKAREPAYHDTGDYTIKQGHDVGNEQR